MYEPGGRQFPYLALLWPAFVAASASEMAAFTARQFADFAAGIDGPAGPEPKWATPHRLVLELPTVRLRDFSIASASEAPGMPILLCAPLSLHGAAMADFAPGHSLVGALRRAGARRLFVSEWRSATPDMRFRGIDEYLADLNVMVDEVGAPVDLVGLCQGGWMALLYAARFPQKVRKLVLAGAPVDIAAASSSLSALADASPLPLFRELVRIGDGVVPGRKVMKFWGTDVVGVQDAREVLQSAEPVGSAAFARLEALFQNWNASAIDLPGEFFLEVVQRLYKENGLATGGFVALGRRIDLAAVTAPIFLLAARDDELVAVQQLFAAEKLVGTPAEDIGKATVPCGHIALFMGKTVLEEIWPTIFRWLEAPSPAPAVAAAEPRPAERLH